jgi:YggT family protein
MRIVVYEVSILVTLLQLAIFLRVVLSWFPMGPDNALVRLLNQVTEPLLAPLHRFVPRMGAIDLTPTAAIVVLFAVQQGLAHLGA